MPSRSRQLVAALSLALVLSAVAACSEKPPPPRDPGALAIVVGGRNNMPKPKLPDDLQNSIVEDAIRSEDTLYIVEVSGKPRQVRDPEKMASKCDGPRSCASVVNHFLKLIEQQIADVKASAPEADTLGAIAVAARAIEQSPGRRQLIVIDNGLQTAGDFRLQNTRVLFTDQDTDLDLLAKRLLDNRRLEKTLAGVEITWVGLGSSARLQNTADQRPLDNLRKLWEKILQAAEVAQVTFAGGLQDGAPPAHENLPDVTPVDVEDEPIDGVSSCTTVFDDQVGFLPDRTEFRDPARARAVLEPIARGLIERRQAALLVGYVALPERPEPPRLSQRRADAVRDLLVELGVPASLLRAEGRGLAPEAPPNPAPELLPQYRRVEIISGDCGRPQ